MQALSLSACSKAWRQLVTQDERLWQAWAASHLPPPLLRAAAAAAAAGQSWRGAYERATRLQSLRRVEWSGDSGEQQGGSVAGRRPRPREGHAACAWGARSMLVCGGFGGGILSGGDLHLLTPAKRSSGSAAGSDGSSGSSSPGGSTSSSASGGLRWVQPRVSGRPPVHRYGHTLTRCGEVAVLFGGLQAGGYQAPLDTLAVLRRRAAPPGCGAASSGAAGTAGPAAAPGFGAGSDDEDGSGSGPGSGGREEDTSLALRLGGWQGGADGGGLHQLLWAQMFDFFQGLDDDLDDEEDEGDGEEDGEEEDELSDGDSQGAGSSAEEEEGGLGSESAGTLCRPGIVGRGWVGRRCCRCCHVTATSLPLN